jgi:hypothetical protein
MIAGRQGIGVSVPQAETATVHHVKVKKASIPIGPATGARQHGGLLIPLPP